MTSAAEVPRPARPQEGQPGDQRPQDQRRRDPRRRQRILSAAAELVAERGYHEVGMADIGAAAGITGSAIYRHFDGKSAVLVAMFDHVIDDLSGEASEMRIALNESGSLGFSKKLKISFTSYAPILAAASRAICCTVEIGSCCCRGAFGSSISSTFKQSD